VVRRLGSRRGSVGPVQLDSDPKAPTKSVSRLGKAEIQQVNCKFAYISTGSISKCPFKVSCPEAF
jgi:hypothetical protein